MTQPPETPAPADVSPDGNDATVRVPAEPASVPSPVPTPTAHIPAHYAPPPPRRPRRRPAARPLTWRVPAAILIAFLVIFPGAVAIIDAYEKNPFTRALRERVLVGSILTAIGFVVFLAFVYVIAYVISAAWHDARNARRRDDRE